MADEHPLVTITDAHPERIYSISDFEPYMLEPPTPAAAPRAPRTGISLETPQQGDRPGDLFNRDNTADDVLISDGWVLHHTDSRSGERHYTRPGKNTKDGPSATVYPDGHACVWTDATDLEPRRWYDAFGLLAALRHAGDIVAATADVRARGYGAPLRNSDTTPETAPVDPDAPWDEPIPLKSTWELPPFPIESLPRWFAQHAAALADEIQTPVDLPAAIGITALAAACARKVEIDVNGGWVEGVNLYSAIAMPPGSAKSVVSKRMTSPLQQAERELADAAAAEIREADTTRKMFESKLAAVIKKGQEVGEARKLANEIAELPIKARPKLIVEDITVEKLEMVLAEQGRVALLSTEGGLFDNIVGRYSETSNFDTYLKAWSGDEIRVDRVSGRELVVTDATLTIGITVQPSVIEKIAERPDLAGRGLTARFMYAMPPNYVGRRDFRKAGAPDGVAASVYHERLHGITRRLARYAAPTRIQCSAEAFDMFTDWRQDIEDRRGEGRELEHMAEWTVKLEQSVLRLAALLHVAEAIEIGVDEPIGRTVAAETMARSIAVGDYWLQHAKAVHDLWGISDSVRIARVIFEWLQRDAVDTFTRRDAHRGARRIKKADDIQKGIDELEARGWVRALPIDPGKKQSQTPYATHPHIRSGEPVTNGTVTAEPDTSVTSVTSVLRDIEKLSISLSTGGSAQGTPRTDETDVTADEPLIEDYFG